MTPETWKKQEIAMKGKITRLTNKMKKAGTLAEKLEVIEQVKAARESLRHHRLNYFELTSSFADDCNEP